MAVMLNTSLDKLKGVVQQLEEAAILLRTAVLNGDDWVRAPLVKELEDSVKLLRQAMR